MFFYKVLHCTMKVHETINGSAGAQEGATLPSGCPSLRFQLLWVFNWVAGVWRGLVRSSFGNSSLHSCFYYAQTVVIST